MPQNPANLMIPAGMEIFRAPVGTTAPTDPTTAYGAGWNSLGLLGEDGVIFGRDSDTNDLFAISATGSTFVRRTEDHQSRNFQFTLVEDTSINFLFVNPGSTQTSGGGVATRTHKTRTYASLALGIDLYDGATRKRYIIPTGQVTDIGDTTYTIADEPGIAVTFMILPASDGSFMIEYTNLAGAL